MSVLHPIRALCDSLEDARVKAIEAVAAQKAPRHEDLSELAALQGALTAVRQTIEEHGERLGWSGTEEQLEQAARKLIENR